jgi:hypothetical protein
MNRDQLARAFLALMEMKADYFASRSDDARLAYFASEKRLRDECEEIVRPRSLFDQPKE